MNEVFLIGKIVGDIKYKFMLQKSKNAKAILNIKITNKTKLEIIAYNEQADYAFKNLKAADTVFIYAKLLNDKIHAIEISKM